MPLTNHTAYTYDNQDNEQVGRQKATCEMCVRRTYPWWRCREALRARDTHTERFNAIGITHRTHN